MRKILVAVLLLCAVAFCGCAKKDLLDEVSGVWRASDNTLVTINHDDKKFQFAIGGGALNTEIASVDEKNQLISFSVNHPAGKVIWTIQHGVDKETKAPLLVFTMHDGTQATFSLVRKITPADLDKFASAGGSASPAAMAQQTAKAGQPSNQPPETQPDAQSASVEREGVCAGLDLVVTADMLECLGRKYDLADRELNEIYKRLMANRDDTRKAALKNEQLAWIKQKESTCSQAGKEVEGGTLETVMINDCLVQETVKRVAYLKGLN